MPEDPSTVAVADRAAGTINAPSLPRHRALDGLRGLAVAGVLVYHLDLGYLTGGFLGVSLFFTISGFLITSLVLSERDHHGRVAVRRFWARRFRRLLPAAWAGLGVATVYALFAADADQLRRLPADVLAALAYVANWQFILAGNTYTAGYQAPSPVLHFWSLAIEEQFYVLFPLLVAGLIARQATRKVWFVVMGSLLVASMVATMVIYDPERTANVYFGTATRAAELLAGVLLAVALHGWWSRRSAAGTGDVAANPLVPSLAGAAALVGTGALWWVADTRQDWLYRGGLWVVAALSTALIWSVMRGGMANRLLAWRPLVGLGLISYGVYVYHWPLFLWITPETTGLTGVALVVVRLGATLAVALASFFLLEQPIRHGRVHVTPITVLGTLAALVLIVAGALWAGSLADARAVETAEAARPAAPVITQPPATAKPAAGSAPARAPVAPPKRVLIMGDSIVHQAYPVIEARFAAAGIETRAIGGPGESLLAKQGAWLGELREAIDQFDPDVVVLESCCGYGDAREPFIEDGRPVALDSDEVWRAWRRVAAEAVGIAESRGATVAWVLAPPAETNGYYGPIESRIGTANQIVLDLADAHPGLELVDWRVIAGPDGGYVQSLPDATGQLVAVRAQDGLHFTPAGMDILADLTVREVLAAWQRHGGRAGP